MKTISRLFCVLTAAFASQLFVACSDEEEYEDIYGKCEISGTVLNVDNEPVADAKVTVLNEGIGTYNVSTTTDKNGYYEVKMAKASASVIIEVLADGYQDSYNVAKIGYLNPEPGVSLGTASIVVDIQLYKKN